jgi:hypothetical protein
MKKIVFMVALALLCGAAASFATIMVGTDVHPGLDPPRAASLLNCSAPVLQCASALDSVGLRVATASTERAMTLVERAFAEPANWSATYAEVWGSHLETAGSVKSTDAYIGLPVDAWLAASRLLLH